MSMSTMKKKDEEEEEERWKGLPEDIMHSIAQQLCLSDYQSFRQVCPNWRAAVDRGIATETCHPAPQLPYLLHRSLCDPSALYIQEDRYSLVTDPHVSKKGYSDVSRDASSWSYPHCVGSIGAWLIIQNHQHISSSITVVNFLLNPVSRARVMLPSEPANFTWRPISYPLIFKKVVASSPPTCLKQQQDLCVAGLGYGLVAFCRPTDTSWTVISKIRIKEGFKDIEIIDGKLYTLSIINQVVQPYMDVYSILPGPFNSYRREDPVPFPDDLLRCRWGGYCLVKDSKSKELFMIVHKISLRQNSQNKQGIFRVFKLANLKTNAGAPWEEVVDLGDRILFLSDESNLFIRDKTLEKNCIYFAFFGYDFRVYSLTDRSIKPLVLPEGYSNDITLWFTPHPW